MKRMILLLCIGILCSIQAYAQRIKIGPEIGINWNKFNVDHPDIDEDDYKMIPGLKVGGIVDIGFNRMLSFQPGLYYSMKGSKEKYSYGLSNGDRVYVNNRFRINYLEIPMNLQLKFGHPYRGQFFVGAGPYLAFAIGGEVKVRSTIRDNNGFSVPFENEDYDLEIGDDEFDDDVKGADAGLNLNMGFIAPRGFFLRGNAGIGLANIDPRDDDNSVRNFGLSLTAGFLFGR